MTMPFLRHGVGELAGWVRHEIDHFMGKKDVILSSCHRDYFGDAGAVFSAEKLRSNTSVRLLAMPNCRIGAVGARALAESLAEDNATLKKLYLHGNGLSDEGVESMAQMLKKNTALEQLFLGACGVGARGARALGEALKENATLTRLDLESNAIGDDDAEAFAEALRWNESLERLDLPRCQLSDAGASSLLSALRESNSTLTYLTLQGNNDVKGQAIKESIQELVQENKAVQPASAERRARCLLFCCLQLAPKAHEHVVPSIGAVPVPVMQYAMEHAGELHVAKRFEVGDIAAGQSSSAVRDRSSSSDGSDLQPAAARRR